MEFEDELLAILNSDISALNTDISKYNPENDLQILADIVSQISLLDAGGNLLDCLKKIGDLASKITFNNSDLLAIRNRFGLIGSRSNICNKNGIDFFSLQALRYLQEGHLLGCDFEKLIGNLRNISKKVGLIIEHYQSKKNIKDFQLVKVEDGYFKEFIKEFYCKKLISDIVVELELLKDVDFSDQSQTNIYFVSRIFAKAGELAKEYLDFSPATQVQDRRNFDLVLDFLKNSRDDFNHNPSALLDKGLVDLNIKDITDKALTLLQGGEVVSFDAKYLFKASEKSVSKDILEEKSRANSRCDSKLLLDVKKLFGLMSALKKDIKDSDKLEKFDYQQELNRLWGNKNQLIEQKKQKRDALPAGQRFDSKDIDDQVKEIEANIKQLKKDLKRKSDSPKAILV